MSEKCYYGYVRPKLPNHPWSLEKIPLGKSILSISKSSEVKGKGYIPFDLKLLDDINLTVNRDGSFTLPVGRYLIQMNTMVELPVAGTISFEIGKYPMSINVQAETPSSLSGMTVLEITDSTKSVGFINPGKESIKVSNSIVAISKI